MISKEQFLELKHLKSLGVPTTTIAKKLGISRSYISRIETRVLNKLRDYITENEIDI